MSELTSGKRQAQDPQSQVQSQEAGATLVEILVAAAIVSMALVILVSALSTGAFAVRTSNRLTTANNLAASQLESIKADQYSEVVAGNHSPVGVLPGYTVEVITSTIPIHSGLLQVTVTVSYQGEALVTVSNYKVDR